MTRSACLILALALLGCGSTSGAGTTRRSSASGPLEPLAYLFDVAAPEIEVLRPPERSIEELTEARSGSRGAERRAVFRDLARAHLVAARNSEGRDQRHHREEVERYAENAAQNSHDDQLEVEMDFLVVWMGYEFGSRNAATRAQRFTERHRTAGEMLRIAWMIRGELELAREEWDDALEAFRFAMGDLDHVLYAYALYRTAAAHRGEGDEDGARQALTEAAAIGCDRDEAPVLRVALLAADELGAGVRRDAGGTTRPASCPERTEGGEHEDEGWHPPE